MYMYMYVYPMFMYIIHVHVDLTGYCPLPGEIFFSLGLHDDETSMSWHYGEPRAITRLFVLPVPFSLTSEEDAPVDIKVMRLTQ